MLGALAEKNVSMSTNMHTYSTAERTQKHTITATHKSILGLTWLLSWNTLLTVFERVRGENTEDRHGGQWKMQSMEWRE